ncbi:hypothetical protein GCM10027591_03670 [Zhihengliuella somnathii]
MRTLTHEPQTAAAGGVPPTSGHGTIAAGQPEDPRDDRMVLVGYDAEGRVNAEVHEGGIWFDIEDIAGDLNTELRNLTGSEPGEPALYDLGFDPSFFDEEPMNVNGCDAIRQDTRRSL